MHGLPLLEENRVLKEQLRGRRLGLTDNQRRRLAAKWTYPAKKRVGRPGLMKSIKKLIVTMATANPGWGRCRIQGELKQVGHKVCSSTVSNVLKENGIPPAPQRPSSWRSFIQAHWGHVVATDFFSLEVWTPKGLKTHYVLFFIDLKTRAVEIAGITTTPNEAFMAQVARNLTDPVDGFLRNATLLVCDRDTKYTAAFKNTLKNAGTKIALTPYRAPNCNAYAERFVLSIKSECLNKMIFFGEASLRRAIREYIAHYNSDRPHQGIGNATIQKSEQGAGVIECHERLGGLLKSYRRAA